jgi:hypothetical protein
MRKSEVEAGLQKLADDVAEAHAALSRGDDEIGLENVGPRIEELCVAAMQLPPEESREMQPALKQVRDDLQELSAALGAAIEAEQSEEDPPPTAH